MILYAMIIPCSADTLSIDKGCAFSGYFGRALLFPFLTFQPHLLSLIPLLSSYFYLVALSS